MTKIVDILGRAYWKSLVLLDELGAGTDPVEGSALARAILSHLHRRRITTLVATHYSDLKVYAHATPGVENASVEFDVETLGPTFKLTIGLPGQSNALAIAAGLGLAKKIVSQASRLLTPEDLEVEGLLADIKRARDQAVAANIAAEEARAEAEQLKHELQEQLLQIEQDRREVVNRARHQARMELAEVRKELRTISKALKPEIKPHRLAKAKAQLKELEEEVAPPEPPIRLLPIDKEKLRVGQSVWVEDLRQKGQITAFLDDEEVEIGVGKFRVKARLDYLELVEEEPERAHEATYVAVTPSAPPPMTLQLRGHRAEEAIIELDKYLDKAYLALLPEVRIVHGKGTGVLRRLVREELHKHPLVASYRPGAADEGGNGVTIAELVE